jgi:protein-tyrosine phosphatase
MPAGSVPNETSVATVLFGRRNLRDLGGLPTRDGLVVRPGRFFRSSALARFDSDEQRALNALRLHTVIDLRTDSEVARSATMSFSAGVKVTHLPLFQAPRQNWIDPADQRPRATAGRYLEMLEDGVGTLAAVVRRVVQRDASPFLISCTAGRDRTGIVVSCLLDLLDVTDEAIGADYARSDDFDQGSGRAHAGTVQELFALVRGRYGSTQCMLAPYGVTTSVNQALRRELLQYPR